MYLHNKLGNNKVPIDIEIQNESDQFNWYFLRYARTDFLNLDGQSQDSWGMYFMLTDLYFYGGGGGGDRYGSDFYISGDDPDSSSTPHERFI